MNGREALQAKEARLRGLLLCGLSGDALAYQAFLKELSTHLRSFLRRRMPRLPDEVEDLVQESLLAIHNQRHTYDPDQPLSTWVQAIARYKLVDLLRRRSVKESLTDPLDETSEIFATNDNVASEANRDIKVLLEELPDQHRLPIIHVKLQGLSVKEAAAKTGMSESAIKVGIHRGLKILAARMRESG